MIRLPRSNGGAKLPSQRIPSGRIPSHLTESTSAREQSHRRVVLVGVAGLILLSTSPVLGHHVTEGMSELFAGRDHVWALCVIALHLLLEPVHRVFHWLLLGGLAYALWERGRAWFSLRRVLGRLDVSSPPPEFVRAASRAGVDAHALRVISGLPNPAFTAGWVSPRIYLARELGGFLNEAELTAVIAHEHAHVRRRDPARLSALRFLGHALFWLPALRRLAEDAADEAEIRADDEATRGAPLTLASAILGLARWHAAPSGLVEARAGDSALKGSGVVGIQRDGLLDRRIRRLLGEETPVRSHVTSRSLAAALAGLVLVWVSGLAVAHPLPTAGSPHATAAHCLHEDSSAISHLFCLGWRYSPQGGVVDGCPHDAHRHAGGRRGA